VYTLVCLMAGAGIAVGLAWNLWRKPPTAPQVVRFTIKPGPNETLAPGPSPDIAFSPDGTSLAYTVVRGGRQQFYLRRVADLEAKPISGTEDARGAPVFSPDGQWLAFLQASKWKKVPLTGGPPVTMFDYPLGGAWAAAWGPDNTLVFGLYPAGMARVPAAGGRLQNVPILDPQKNERWGGSPQWLPGGKAVLFGMRTADVDSFNDYRTAVYSFQTGQRKILIEGGVRGTYLPPGYLVHVRGGTFLAAPFDLAKLAATGPPVPVLDGVYQNAVNGGAKFAISENGSLAYVPGGEVAGARKAVWVDRQGKEQPLPLPLRSYLHPRISPDGLQLAIEVEGPNHDVFTYDLTRGTLTKVTFDGSSHWPLWTPDGRRLTFRIGMPAPFTMWAMPADRSGPKERLTTIGAQQSAGSWSPDGRVVAFTQVSPETAGDIYVVAMDGERKPRAFAQTKFNEGSPRFSPDGRWIAYSSNESGRNEIYVQEYPGPGAKIQISTEGGTDPVWKPNGGELYYRKGEKMMVVAVATSPAFSAGKPGVLWEGRYNEGQNSMCGPPGAGSSNYDVTSDGQRFLMVKEGEQDGPPTEIRVVLNWFEEVKRIVESKKI
nr:hypothetical protein [Acidobacteriota bacterium]